jgi:hypothetical protein
MDPRMITMDELLKLEGEAVEVCMRYSSYICYDTACALIANWIGQHGTGPEIRKRLDAYYKADDNAQGNAPGLSTYLTEERH